MIRIGLAGAGHLGKIHMQQWLQVPDTTFIGFYDHLLRNIYYFTSENKNNNDLKSYDLSI